MAQELEIWESNAGSLFAVAVFNEGAEAAVQLLEDEGWASLKHLIDVYGIVGALKRCDPSSRIEDVNEFYEELQAASPAGYRRVAQYDGELTVFDGIGSAGRNYFDA